MGKPNVISRFEIQQLALTSFADFGYLQGYTADGALLHSADVVTFLTKWVNQKSVARNEAWERPAVRRPMRARSYSERDSEPSA